MLFLDSFITAKKQENAGIKKAAVPAALIFITTSLSGHNISHTGIAIAVNTTRRCHISTRLHV